MHSTDIVVLCYFYYRTRIWDPRYFSFILVDFGALLCSVYVPSETILIEEVTTVLVLFHNLFWCYLICTAKLSSSSVLKQMQSNTFVSFIIIMLKT